MVNLYDKDGISLYRTNRKEYYRRKSISNSVKIYWDKVKSGELKRINYPDQPSERIRKQVILSYKTEAGVSGSGAFVDIRTATINPQITIQGLKIATSELKYNFEANYNINLKKFEESYQSFPIEKIGINEDTKLNDYNIHYQIILNGKIVSKGILKV